MARWKRIFAKLVNLFRSERAEREMSREINSHLTLIEDEFVRLGMTAEEASAAAKRAYGGIEQSKEAHRDERSFVWLEQVRQDTRHAYRSLTRSPRFVAVAVISLALGIGVNSAIFTLVNGILLKKLPSPDADRIVQVSAKLKTFETSGFNYPVLRELRRQNAIFADVVAFSGRPGILEVDGDQRNIDLELVTGSFFAFFGAQPALGRLLNDEDDQVEDANPVCVLSYEAWQARFGGDPRIVGRAIRVDGAPLQVVGVASRGFVGGELQRCYELWAPTAALKAITRTEREIGWMVWLHILGKLKPGTSFSEAQSRLQGAGAGIEGALPIARTNKGAVYNIRDGSKGDDGRRTELRGPLLVLLGAVALVLLVACANLANLLLARANERNQEFTIKLALKISRWRLLRQLLLETLALTLTGGAVGILLSLLLIQVLLTLFNSGSHSNSLYVRPDASVLVFTFGACLLTTLIAGLYPAWWAARTDAAGGLFASLIPAIRATRINPVQALRYD